MLPQSIEQDRMEQLVVGSKDMQGQVIRQA